MESKGGPEAEIKTCDFAKKDAKLCNLRFNMIRQSIKLLYRATCWLVIAR